MVVLRGAREGDRVRVKYVGRFPDGTVFDSSAPFVFRLGDGSAPPGFDKGVLGMNRGEVRRLEMPASRAYGPRRREMIMEVSLDRLAKGLDPAVGDVLEVKLPSGRAVNAVVTDVSETRAVLDANHPLAGLDLIFEIELIEIETAEIEGEAS